MAEHTCTEKSRIERLEKFLDGNGGKGLNKNFAALSGKVDTLTITVDKIDLKVDDLTAFMQKVNSSKATKQIVIADLREKRKFMWLNIRWGILLLVTIIIAVVGIIIT